METVDFKKRYKELYSPKPGTFSQVKVPKMTYLMIDGKGDPRTSVEYQHAIEALYSVSYTLKFTSKKELAKDYTVAPLEGLWWSDDMGNFTAMNTGEWRWTMMIMLPEWIPSKMLKEAVATVALKRPTLDLSGIRREALTEGLCVQTMHVGPYDAEGPTITELHTRYLPDNKLVPNGKHHEIYLSDPRRSAPEKLKTIMRQPVKRVK